MIELYLNDTMGDYLNRKAMSLITCKSKLMEAAFKEKELDAYFCLSLVL